MRQRPYLYKTLVYPLFSPEDMDLADFKWHQDAFGYAFKGAKRAGPGGTYGNVHAHKIVCERVFGRKAIWANHEVTDHINRDRLDNRRQNLRIGSHRENWENGAQCDTARGFVQRGKKWRAYIRVNRKLIQLGSHDTPEAARQAHLEAVKTAFPARYQNLERRAFKLGVML